MSGMYSGPLNVFRLIKYSISCFGNSVGMRYTDFVGF